MRHQVQRATREEYANAEFLGTAYSNQELTFLIEHLGEPPEVACPEDADLPNGVNRSAVAPILDRTHRLHLMEQAAKEKLGESANIWVGFDKLRAICEETLAWNAQTRDLKERTVHSNPAIRRAAGAPSLHLWDPDTDIPYLGGVGADADIVRTALGPGGKRIPLYTALRETGLGSIQSLSGVAGFLKHRNAESQRKAIQSAPNALLFREGGTTSSVVCPICEHAESFETAKPHTKRQAEQRMMRHLRSTRVKRDTHAILLKRLESGKAGTGPGEEPEEPEETEE